MEIQFLGGTTFEAKGKKARIAFNMDKSPARKDADIATRSDFKGLEAEMHEDVKKFISLPGEYEVSGVLAKGLLSGTNIIYKIVLDATSIAHFGNLEGQPANDLLKELGDVDIALINASKNFNEKEVKILIETIDPRMAIIGGDQALFPKITTECLAQTAEKNPLVFKKSELSDDVTNVLILPV